ncbi:EscU/YscU/HrcU family type III secretion system export apparatus switch protein [Salinicola rhizosphaerae]|uniref:Flagellar biosynthetic protein FlhB n=1 Tax=Salinicola rhizosphaerae TaxID=1443141 RepID=A0ABQ3DQE3_9GAMM|nr:EscU/YscU/HrcU family type III secretion system export apparatus switch protein [Salinicola rhizosphaerae]GHB11888.1 translocation protein in type III secretion system, RhcU [Salinicola rhizosphaerae]
MSQQPSEEKSLPPSAKKLRDARKKGQVTKSADLVTAMVMLACTLYIGVSASRIVARVEGLIDLTARLYTEPFDTLWPRLIAQAGEVLVISILPLVALTVLVVILTNVVVSQGFVFAAEPVLPKAEKVNPVEGFKRIFSVRGVTEFLKSLFKMTALAVALIVVYRLGLQSLMESSQCGLGCVQGTFLDLLQPLVITALIAFLIVGAFDVLLQRWLFRRDQRMTKTEQKRERKDQEGDPTMNQARRKQRREMHALNAKIGVQHASLMVGTGDGWLVGIRYVRGETPVPVITCKASAENAPALLESAYQRRIPRVDDPVLAEKIATRAGNGDPIPDGTFQPIADVLVAAKLI